MTKALFTSLDDMQAESLCGGGNYTANTPNSWSLVTGYEFTPNTTYTESELGVDFNQDGYQIDSFTTPEDDTDGSYAVATWTNGGGKIKYHFVTESSVLNNQNRNA